MSKRRRQFKKPRDHKRSTRPSGANADLHAKQEQLLRMTARKARETIGKLLERGDVTHVDLEEWLLMLNELLIQVCAPLAVDHVIVLGHGELEDGLQVYTATNLEDRELAHQLVALGHDSIAAGDDDELCPDCQEAADKHQSELS